MPFEVYLFDFDGTIADTSRGIKNAIKYALAQKGIPVGDESRLDYFIGPPLYDGFSHVYGTTEPDTSECVDLYRVYYSNGGVFETDLYDGIKETLLELKSAGAKLAITSSKPQFYLDMLMPHLGLQEVFDKVIGPEMNNRLGDKSVLVNLALQQLDYPLVDGSKVCIVGDRFYDMAGGVKAGVTAVGALWGFGSREELEEAGASYLVEQPMQLLDL